MTGPDGRLWFAEAGGLEVGAVTTGGDLTECPLPSVTHTLRVTAGPDGLRTAPQLSVRG